MKGEQLIFPVEPVVARTETLIADAQVPQVHPEVISGNVGLLVRVDRDRVNVVRMGVRVDLAGDGGDDVVLVGHPRQPEMRG